MKQSYAKRVSAFFLALALTVSGAGLSAPANTAVAKVKAKKKVMLKLDKSSCIMKAGTSRVFKIKKKNVKKIKLQKWSSSRKAIASVSAKGKVTAKKAGSTKIKVKVKYIGKGTAGVKTKQLQCSLKVTGAEKSSAVSTLAPSPAAQPTAAATPTVTVDPETVIFRDPVAPENVTAHLNYNDTTNIGEEREISIVGGTSESMTVKDNGVMRKELSTRNLIDTEMGAGINLGNTMEAVPDSIDDLLQFTDAGQFEQTWGQPVTTQEYIDCVHSYGINTVRIPVAWSNMVDEENYVINEKYLGRVEEIVNYVLNNGMYAIINIHWDNGWWGQFGACERDANNKKVPNDKFRQAAWERYESYWEQIAERFRDYSDHLIFEGANEELGSKLNSNIYLSTGHSKTLDPDEDSVSGNLNKEELYEMVNNINQTFVDTVRKSGGNNIYRHLLIPGYDTDIGKTCDAKFKMPTDLPENANTKLSLSVHYYQPWTFCGDKASGVYSLADQIYTQSAFAPLQKFVDAGYGIIIGECGVVEPELVEGGVTQWLNDMFTEAARYHAQPVIWEISNYFDRKNAKLKFKDVAEFYNSITGARGDTGMTETTGRK